MLGSLIRGWRRRHHFGRHLSHIQGIIRLESFGFTCFPWTYALWEALQDRLGASKPLRQDELEVAACAQLPLRDLTLLAPTSSLAVLDWDEVREIWAYKVDLFTVDSIHLRFNRRDESWIEVSEDTMGWCILTEAMTARFPTIPADWWRSVAFPAFAANVACIWPSRTRESTEVALGSR